MKTSSLHQTLATGVAGLALTAGVLAGISRPAEAASYSYRVVGQQIIIDASGVIEPNEAEIYNAWIGRVMPDNGRVAGKRVTAWVLNSPGGSVDGALDMAAFIRKNGFATGVAAGGMCASACTIAWSAGVRRSVAPDALVGVHSATIKYQERDASGNTVTSPKQVSPETNAKVANALAYLGMTQGVINRMWMTPPNGMYWLTADDFAALGTKVAW